MPPIISSSSGVWPFRGFSFLGPPKPPNMLGAGGLLAERMAASRMRSLRMLAHSFMAQEEAVVPSEPPPTGVKVSR